MIWLAVFGAFPAAAGACEITAEGAPTRELDCSRAALWTVRCKVAPEGRRRVHIEVPEWDLHAETRLPPGGEDRFEVTLLGPNGTRGDFTVDALRPRLASSVVSALQLCRPGSGPGTLQVSVTRHLPAGSAEEVGDDGTIAEVPLWDAGNVVATAEARIKPLPGGAAAPLAPPEPVSGKLSVRQGEQWVDLRWSGRKEQVSADAGPVTLLRLDFPADRVVEALGPGDASALLADDLVRWLSGDVSSRLGLVAFRRSEVPVPVAEVPTFDLATGGWRTARGGTTALAIGPVGGGQVRVAVAFRSQPLDDAARAAVDARARAPISD